MSDDGKRFGRHIRSLRRARGQTQEQLAACSSLSADTIRRLEHGAFSPSLETLRKLCVGFDLLMSTLFESFELGERNETRELMDLLACRTPRELVLATRMLRALFDELDLIASEGAKKSDEASEPDEGSET
jgi:transcriptional regulator with XRE-family HTH domain